MTDAAWARRLGHAPHHHENALLLAATRYPRPGAFDADVPPALDWGYLVRAANRQGVTPLLADWLARRPAVDVPAEVRGELRSAAWVAHFRARALLEELASVLTAATARGVLVMPLKGALLAPCYYPTPDLRPMSDLDLLVRPADYEAFAAILGDLGYYEVPGPPYLLDERLLDPFRRERAFTRERQGLTLLVEYRSEPLDPMVWQLTDLDPALATGLRRHTARTWARATRESLPGAAGASFARLSPEDLLLHLASHLITRHADYRLLWLHDLCRVTATHDSLDWDYLAREARALRLAGPVFAALQAARRWLGAPLPLRMVHDTLFGGAWRLASPLEIAERGLLLYRLRALREADLAAPPPGELALQVGSLVRLRGIWPRARALRWALFPGRTYMAGWRGERSGAGYAATLALRLVILALRAASGVGRPLGFPALAGRAERVVRWLEGVARLEPFALYAIWDDGTTSRPR